MTATTLRPAFVPVASPFGGTDEAATHEAFVDFVGGRARAEELSRLHQNSWPGISASPFVPAPTKTEVFTRKAREAGFSQAEIAAFLSL